MALELMVSWDPPVIVIGCPAAEPDDPACPAAEAAVAALLGARGPRPRAAGRICRGAGRALASTGEGMARAAEILQDRLLAERPRRDHLAGRRRGSLALLVSLGTGPGDIGLGEALGVIGRRVVGDDLEAARRDRAGSAAAAGAARRPRRRRSSRAAGALCQGLFRNPMADPGSSASAGPRCSPSSACCSASTAPDVGDPRRRRRAVPPAAMVVLLAAAGRWPAFAVLLLSRASRSGPCARR